MTTIKWASTIPTWFFAALTGGWGKELSGKTTESYVNVDILVKVNRFHLI
ncbi:hypothetical protein MBGDN05_00299, partial [Thermoplasmatales archaeon SCGC AB-539-N05]